MIFVISAQMYNTRLNFNKKGNNISISQQVRFVHPQLHIQFQIFVNYYRGATLFPPFCVCRAYMVNSSQTFTGWYKFSAVICAPCIREAMDGQKNCHQKRVMSFLSPVFSRQYCPWCHVSFMKNERLKYEIKISLRYYGAFYQHNKKLYQTQQY